MYGINLVEVARILGTSVISSTLTGQSGVISIIYQEIIKYSAQQDIEMVKVMMRMLSQQNEAAYNDVMKILRENFSDQELQEIMPF